MSVAVPLIFPASGPFPASVRWRWTAAFDDPVALDPQEAAAVAAASSIRQREFAAVRGCARRALADLGHGPAPILPGAGGAPTWPNGIVGSMTHCSAFAAAAVAECCSGVRGLGIDAEPDQPLPGDVLGAVTTPSERRHWQDLPDNSSTCWARLTFSAKEAVYKAVFPLSQAWLDFHEVEVLFNRNTQQFRAVLGPAARRRVPDTVHQLAGRWTKVAGHLVTGVAVTGDVRGGARGRRHGGWSGTLCD